MKFLISAATYREASRIAKGVANGARLVDLRAVVGPAQALRGSSWAERRQGATPGRHVLDRRTPSIARNGALILSPAVVGASQRCPPCVRC